MCLLIENPIVLFGVSRGTSSPESHLGQPLKEMCVRGALEIEVDMRERPI